MTDTDIERIAEITGADEDLIEMLGEDCEQTVLAMTNRTVLNTALEAAVRRLTIIAYNRLGMEGESSRSEAGISSSFVEIPADIDRIIKQNRLVRVSGHAYEKESE